MRQALYVENSPNSKTVQFGQPEGTGNASTATMIWNKRFCMLATHRTEWAEESRPPKISRWALAPVPTCSTTGASVANDNYGAMRAKFCADCLSTPVCRDRKALPLFDVCFLTTNTNKGRAMSGKAARVFFDRINVHNFDPTC